MRLLCIQLLRQQDRLPLSELCQLCTIIIALSFENVRSRWLNAKYSLHECKHERNLSFHPIWSVTVFVLHTMGHSKKLKSTTRITRPEATAASAKDLVQTLSVHRQLNGRLGLLSSQIVQMVSVARSRPIHSSASATKTGAESVDRQPPCETSDTTTTTKTTQNGDVWMDDSIDGGDDHKSHGQQGVPKVRS
jgi:hypothetical protein